MLVSVLDARTNKENSEEAIATLKRGLSQTYGNSLEWSDYFSEVPSGQVAVKIRLKANEAAFGSRITSAISIENRLTTAYASVTNSWKSVIGTASAHQSILTSTFSAEGWWVGTAWIEVEVYDHRDGKSESFILPMIAEKKEPNTWGYRSGDKAAKQAWSVLGQNLIRFMDLILITLRDQEN